jgi:[ribosomal protein S18]-alanine N-acetyltransferase
VSPTPHVVVVPMDVQHLDAVVAIEERSYPRPWSRATLSSELARDDRRYLVCLEDDEVVGFAGLASGAGEAHVLTVAVAPARRRSGHGGRLVDALLRAAVELGVDGVTLEVRRSDVGTQRLYRAAGFVPAGTRPGYYQDDGEDALIMWWYPDDGGR